MVPSFADAVLCILSLSFFLFFYWAEERAKKGYEKGENGCAFGNSRNTSLIGKEEETDNIKSKNAVFIWM